MLTGSGIAGYKGHLSHNRVRDHHACQPPNGLPDMRLKLACPVLPRNASAQGGMEAGSSQNCDGNLQSSVGYAVIGFAGPVRRYFQTLEPILLKADDVGIAEISRMPIPIDSIGVQVEVAFLMSRDYPGKDEDINIASALTAVMGAYPALVAINGLKKDEASSGIIGGAQLRLEPVRIPLMHLAGDLDIRAVLYRSGVIVWDVTSVLAQPVDGLLWAAENLKRRGAGFKKGEVVSAGTSLFVLDISPGDRLVFDLADKTRFSHAFF